MAVDIAMSSAPAYPQPRRLDLGRTSSLPVPHPHPQIRIPASLDTANSHSSPSATLSPRSPNAPASPSFVYPSLQWRPGPPITSLNGTATKLCMGLDCASGRALSVKSVQSTALPREMRQLEQEQAALERLRGCSHVVQLLAAESTETDGVRTKSLLLEYVSGGSAADMMVRFGGALPETVVRRYARGILQGLVQVHAKGLVHCDLRARSVLVCATTGGPKLCSFGYSLRTGEAADRLARRQRLQGSYQWMAPEVVRQEDQTPASDIWSFGCTLLEMLTGQSPWADRVEGTSSVMEVVGRGDNVPHIPDSLSPDCAKLLRRCLQRDPSLRPAAQQLLQDPFVQAPSPRKHSSARGPGAWQPPSPSPLTSHLTKDRVGQTGHSTPTERARALGGPPARDLVKVPMAPLSPLPGSPVERPKSPDGHDGMCKETLHKAARAKGQAAAPGAQVWTRDESEGDAPAISAADAVQIWQRDPEPLLRTTSLQPPPPPQRSAPPAPAPPAPAPPPVPAASSLPMLPQLPVPVPAISQLLTSPSSVKMGPLMRQISRDAQEFARLAQVGESPAGSDSLALLARASATTQPLSRPSSSSKQQAAKNDSSPVFSPIAPSSPRSNSPLPPSPRRTHRRTGSVQVESNFSAHRRAGSVQIEGGPYSHRRTGSVHIDSSAPVPQFDLPTATTATAEGTPPVAPRRTSPPQSEGTKPSHRRSTSVASPGAHLAHRRTGSVAGPVDPGFPADVAADCGQSGSSPASPSGSQSPLLVACLRRGGSGREDSERGSPKGQAANA